MAEMKLRISLEDIIETEVNLLIGFYLREGNSFQTSKQFVNNLLTNVDISSDSSVSSFLEKSHNIRRN